MLTIGVLAVEDGSTITITGTIEGYSSSVVLRTDSNAGNGGFFDAYDMPVPSSPSDFASFYSSISGATVSIDSWAPAERSEINLVFDVPTGFTGGAINFEWDQPGTAYDATFQYYGISAYVTLVDSSDMDDDGSSYSAIISGDDNIYVRIVVVDEPSSTVSTGGDSGGGGGGGGAGEPETVELPEISVIKDVTTGKLLFDVGIIIPPEYDTIQEGDDFKVLINLDPQIISGDPDLEVRLRYYIKDKETGNEVDVGIGESDWKNLVKGPQTIDKSFNVESLGPGVYELWLELKYEEEPEKWFYADLHSEFTIESREEAEPGALSNYRIVLLALGAAIFVLIILIVVVIIKTKGKKKRK